MKAAQILAAIGLAATLGLVAPVPASAATPPPRPAPVQDGSAAHPYLVGSRAITVRPVYHRQVMASGMARANTLPPLSLCTDWLHYQVTRYSFFGAPEWDWVLHVKWCINSAHNITYYNQFHSWNPRSGAGGAWHEGSPAIINDYKSWYYYGGAPLGGHYSSVQGHMVNAVPFFDLSHRYPWIHANVHGDGSSNATGQA